MVAVEGLSPGTSRHYLHLPGRWAKVTLLRFANTSQCLFSSWETLLERARESAQERQRVIKKAMHRPICIEPGRLTRHTSATEEGLRLRIRRFHECLIRSMAILPVSGSTASHWRKRAVLLMY